MAARSIINVESFSFSKKTILQVSIIPIGKSTFIGILAKTGKNDESIDTLIIETVRISHNIRCLFLFLDSINIHPFLIYIIIKVYA